MDRRGLGVITAGLVHGGKTVSRPVINSATLGLGAPVASTAEDGASAALSFAAIFMPVLGVILLLALIGVIVWAVSKALQRRQAFNHRLNTVRK